MKVCIITGHFPVKTQTFIVRQAIALKADVITTNLNDQDLDKFDLSNIKIHEVKDKFSVIRKKQQALFYRIMGKQYFRWSKNQLKLAEDIVFKNNYDFIIGVFGEHGINASIISNKLNIPYAIQFLGVDGSKWLRNKDYLKYIIPAINSSLFSVALSKDMKKDIDACGAVDDKLIVHNIGVPTNLFKQITLKKETFCKFVAMGRMVEKKSPFCSLKSFEICADKNPNVSFEFIGDGTLFESVKAYVENSRHKSKIKLHGYINNKDFEQIVKKCHVFVQHSVTSKDGDKEGWPVAIAEACSYGLPIISTKHSGIKEQVIPGYNGYLVEEYDIDEMANYMIELSSDFEKCEEYGNNSRTLIEEKGDLNKQIMLLRRMIDLKSRE